MNIGDVVTLPYDNKLSLIKILRIDNDAKIGDTFHCLTYAYQDILPSLADVDSLEILNYHAPMAAEPIIAGGSVIGNIAVSEDSLVGYYYYLKHTNFARYAKETRQNIDAIIAIAQDHYIKANQLSKQNKFSEAIIEYDFAIDLFPLFYEAIDNKGLTKMDMGEFNEAIVDFEHSIILNPTNYIALFSKGECYEKLKEFDKAENVYREGLIKFPQHEATFSKFLNVVKLKNSVVSISSDKALASIKTLSNKKPWWNFWAN